MQEGRRCRRSVFVSVRVFISKVTALRTENVAEFSCVITQFVFHLSVQLEHQATAKKKAKKQMSFHQHHMKPHTVHLSETSATHQF